MHVRDLTELLDALMDAVIGITKHTYENSRGGHCIATGAVPCGDLDVVVAGQVVEGPPMQL